MKAQIKHALFIMAIFLLYGCTGERLGNIGSWLVDHPGALIAILAAISPLLALIPGVGVVIAPIYTKILIAVIPAIKAIAKEIEEDPKARTVEEAAADTLAKLVADNSNKIGKIPLSSPLAKMAAKTLINKARKKALKKGANISDIFDGM